jgi:phosphate transport system substrate-binding protein
MKYAVGTALLVTGLVAVGGCGRSGDAIRVEGSDTMVNLAQAWAERYRAIHPEITVQVLGGGSGVGIASLIDGNCDLANSSRSIEPKELARVKARRGVAPKEIVVGHDALAVYVHKSNPLDVICLDQLAEIYGEGGGISKWSQLGVDPKRLGGEKITRVSRQNSSGTYTYFREAVLGNGRDYKLGSIDQNGSKDVVALISHTPSAIGYSGMGYATPDVKMLKIAKRKGEPGVAPTVENAKQKTYPITRSLLVYAVGEPQGQLKQYVDWMLSPAGQKVVLELGYVPESEHK